MNESKGNMYPDVTHTWNPIRGKCPHECIYCYMKRFPVGKMRLDEKTLNEDLGKGNIIFVGSSTDMFADSVPAEWIEQVLKRCKECDNTYLFQTKNPKRFHEFAKEFPPHIILGTTMETNRHTDKISKAPNPIDRYCAIRRFQLETDYKIPIMISIEPIVYFDLLEFSSFVSSMHPKYVSIGADSKGHKLPEPSKEEIELLIQELRKSTKVKLKDNLRRLL